MMVKSYQLKGEPMPCSHNYADVTISKIYKESSKTAAGESSYFMVFNCRKCGPYEIPVEWLPPGLKRMVDENGEIVYPHIGHPDWK